MKLLLDTHTFLWFFDTPEKLSPVVHDALSDPANACFLSVVSVWEIQIKTRLGKLSLSQSVEDAIRLAVDDGLQILPAELSHVFGLAGLPEHHNDPFDRLLIAQALFEHLTLVTRDAKIREYPVPLLW